MARLRRVVTLAVLAVIGLILASLLVAHSPWARGRALSWATGFVARYDLALEAGSLGYNALTRRVTLTDVRLAATGHEPRPFLVASRIEVTLPWSVLTGGFAIDRLDIGEGRVDIYRDANNVLNLPPGTDGPTPAQPRRIEIRNLTLRGLDVGYEDDASNFALMVPRIESRLIDGADGATGEFAVRGPLTFRLPDRTLTLEPFETGMTFDGSNLTLDQARLSSPEMTLFVAGPIARVLDAPSLDLTVKGSINLDQALAWAPPPPVPLSGLATIDGTITGPTGELVTDLTVSSNSLTVGRERQLTLSGPVRLTLTGVSGKNLTLTPASGGRVRAQFDVPFGRHGVTRVSAEWETLDAQAALRLADLDAQPIGAALSGSATLSFGTPRRIEVVNRAAGRAGRNLAPLSGTFTGTIIGDDYTFDHDHALPGLTFDGELRGRFSAGAAAESTMRGPAQARIADVATAARSLETVGVPVAAIMYDIRGALDVPITLGGTFGRPEIDARVSGDAVVLPVLGEVRAAAAVVADTRRAEITAIDIRRGASAITGAVQVDIANRTLGGTLRAELADAADVLGDVDPEWRVSGPVTADAALGGTFDAFRLDATVNGRALSFAGQPIDRVAAKAVVTGEAVEVTSLQLFQGAGFLDGRVRYAWDSGAYQANLKGDRLTWRGSLQAPDDTQAIFSVRFDGAGTVAQPKGKASLDFVLTGGEAGTLIGAGDATADLDGTQARVVARLPRLGALINAEIATAEPYAYRAKATLDRFELQKAAPFINAIDTEILGFVTGTVTASGRLADDRDRLAAVNITEIDAGIGGVPVSLGAPLTATLKGDAVELGEVFVRVGAGRLSASGTWNSKLDGSFRAEFAGELQDAIRLGKAFGVPAAFDGSGPLSVELRSNGSRAGTTATLALQNGTFAWSRGTHAVKNLTVAAALDGERLTVSRIGGDVATGGIIGSFAASGSAELPELSLAAIDGALVVEAAKFTFSGIPVAQQRPSRIELAKGTVTIADATWAVAENPLLIGGTMGLAAEDPPLDVSVKGLVDLRVLSAVVSTVAFHGTADVDARIAGSVAKPLLDGRVVLDNAEIALADPRVLLSQLSGSLLLDGDRIVFDGIRGLANGGALAVDGALQVAGAALTGGALNIQAQGVALELPRGLRSEIDALVTFRPDLKNPSLTGDIRIVQSAYTETITIAALARQAALPVTPAADGGASYLDRLQLNLAVTTTEGVIVDNNYGRLAADANLRVVGRAGQPGLEGRVGIREGGQIYLAGRTFRITRGDISFADRRRIQPEFNIAAEARVLGDNVTMTLTGTLDRPDIDLTSEDGSRTPGEIAAGIVGSTNAETALTILSADLLGVTGRAIGLDAFRVERGEYVDEFRDYQIDPSLIATDRTDPTTRLTVGKRISDRVEFTVSQNLRANGKATFIISFFPRRTVELRALSRDSGELSFGVRHQVTFGRGVARPPSERRVPSEITALRFVDVSPEDEALARAEIDLEPGDDFDFLALQDDIDAIRDAFRALGYLETRVRTRRVESDDQREVALEYRIERGPQTTLEVAGFAAPSGLIEELEDAWHRSVFDQFLIEELTHRVRRHLVEGDELASVVVGQVERPSPDVKRLRIEVTPGVPVSDREFRFSGNTHLDEDRLRQEISDAGLEIEAWLDRTVVERALRQAYNEEGFLRAEVIGRPLSVDGTAGVLHFDISEGPRAEITDVRWTGVDPARLPQVQKAAELASPQPYVIADVNSARTRIENVYRGLGFNDAEVEMVPDISPGERVALTVEIAEGQQQILQDVELQGLDITSGKVLTEALRFELGQPVDLDAWAVARKRLYDTNVFRLVDIQAVPIGDPANGVQPTKAVVRVEEYPEWSFRYGFQLEGERRLEFDEFTSSRNAGVVGELRNQNLFGRALTLGAFGMYQYDRRDGTLFLATSRLFGWPARSTLYAFVSRERLRDEQDIDIVAINDLQGISADQRWRLGRLQVVYGYRFERNHTYDPEPGNDPLPLDFVANLAKLTSAALLDRRDDPINSRRGTFSSISLEQSGAWLGSDVSNRKLLMQQYVFLPFGSLVLASRAQLGYAFGNDDLLPSDRFLAGGATTVRGYGEESLGPRDFFGAPAGGAKLIVLNQEARFPVYRWAHAVGFVDAGNIFGKAEPFTWSELKVGYGVGLRLDTPIGLLRGDVGFPQSPLPSSRSTGARWYFGFGHIF